MPHVKLPNAEATVVPVEKVRDYLLSLEHPVGRSKARWFARLGYRRERFDELLGQLRTLSVHDAEPLGDEGFGEKFAIVATLTSPGGERYTVRTVWIVPRGETAPRLVTAYPGGSDS